MKVKGVVNGAVQSQDIACDDEAGKDDLSLSGHINRAVGTVAAVLKVFDAVHGLEKSLLSDPRNDLPGYLSVLRRLEKAFRFLSYQDLDASEDEVTVIDYRSL